MARVATALLVLGLLGLAPPGGPRATGPDAPSAIAVEPLGSSLVTGAPGRTLVLHRLTVAPGAAVPAHSHPGDVVFTVVSGALLYIPLLESAEATWSSAAALSVEGRLALGAEVPLQPGDWVREPHGTVQRMSKAGTSPAILLESAIVAHEEPFLRPFVSHIEHRPAP